MATQKANAPFKFWVNFRLRYRLIAFVICLAGLVVYFIETGHIPVGFALFDIQANVACAAMFAFLLVRDHKGKANPKGRVYYFFKGLCIVAALSAMLLYHLVLKSEGASSNGISNLILHTVAPVLIVCDFALFDRKGGYGRLYPFFWTIVPVWYYAVSFLYVSIGGGYPSRAVGAMPYTFMDVADTGMMGVILWAVGILAGFIVLGFVVYAVDHWFAEVRDN